MYAPCVPPYPHSFPTRRSSDLTSPPARSPVRSCITVPGDPARRATCTTSTVGCRKIVAGAWFHSRLRPTERCSSISSRSEEHTSELQSLRHLVCRLLLEKKKKQ